MNEKKARKAGRPEERLVIEGNWKDAVRRFVSRKPDDSAPKKPATKKAGAKKRL